MYWQNVLQEVLNKGKPVCKFSFTNLRNEQCSRRQKTTVKTAIGRHAHGRNLVKPYYLGETYKGIYFTRRESECMVQMLKGKSITATARALKLSPRTVEFYVKNMKRKLNCRTKAELVEKVFRSDFLKNIDFD